MSAPNGWNRMSNAEKIVWFFEHRVSEAHKFSACKTIRITDAQFEQSIPRARDIGIESGLRLTPIYEKDGWWTGYPTERIAAIALRESVERNLGEAERNARVYDSFHKVGPSAHIVEQTNRGNFASIEAQLPEVTMAPEFDYVISRVDKAIAEGKRYVELMPLAVAA
jgi:hypothetical protein